MRLVAMMCCRNEDWILALSARAALMWCDVIAILNHASTDHTSDIIDQLCIEFPGRVYAFTEADQEWHEMDHRQMLVDFARELDPTHLAIVDSDEVLSGNLLASIRAHIESMAPGWILQLPGYNLRGGLDRYHANGIWGQRWFSTAFGDDPRLNWSGDRFHQREPGGASMRQHRPIMQGQGGIMHLWGASERRLRAKHAAYKMIETLRWPSKSRPEIELTYNQAFVPSANIQFEQLWRYAEVPAEWWAPYSELRPCIKLDSIPWQEDMCRTLHVEHGAERFAGLDLFGVISSEVNAGAR